MFRSSIFLILSIFILNTSAYAIRLKGKLPFGAESAIAIPADQSVQNASLDSSTKKKFKLKVAGKKAQLVIRSEATGGIVPVLVAVRKANGRIITPAKARTSGACAEEGVKGLTVFKRSVKGRKRIRLDADETASMGFVKKIKGGSKKFLRRVVDSSEAFRVNIDENCITTGNAKNLGAVAPQAQNITPTAVGIVDTDLDGLPDVFDIDANNNGILNNYDPGFSPGDSGFRVFSNYKVPLINTLNTNTGETYTQSQIDMQLASTATLAIQVLGNEASGDESELDCGILSYCTAGGTGKTLEGSSDFPGAAGGTLDPDGDGNGTITKGTTGDFQLFPGATSGQIFGGNAFQQIVTAVDGTTSMFASLLQFIFNYSPAIKEFTLNRGDASEGTIMFAYPISSGSFGTNTNCIPVSADMSGDVRLEFVLWRPQRAGISGTGEGSVVDVGLSRISVDIPNAPCSSPGACPGTSGPGLCPSSTYTTSDSNLNIGADSLEDLKGDAGADPANTLTFEVNLTDCLATGTETLDPGETLDLDIQFRSPVGDNSAVKLCFVQP